MNTFATKFAVTASIAALILAAPVSVGLTGAGLSVTTAQAQAHEARGGHEHADRQPGSQRAAPTSATDNSPMPWPTTSAAMMSG